MTKRAPFKLLIVDDHAVGCCQGALITLLEQPLNERALSAGLWPMLAPNGSTPAGGGRQLFRPRRGPTVPLRPGWTLSYVTPRTHPATLSAVERHANASRGRN